MRCQRVLFGYRSPLGNSTQPETHCFTLLIPLLISAFKSLWSLNSLPSFVLQSYFCALPTLAGTTSHHLTTLSWGMSFSLAALMFRHSSLYHNGTVHDRNKILHFKMHLMPSHVTLGHMLSAKLVHQEKKNLEE